MSNHVTDNDERALPKHYRALHGAIWLIGLAIIAWQGWWWPGILVLVAISVLVEAGLRMLADRTAHTETVHTTRVRNLPEHCPNCGGPLSPDSVTWANDVTAICPYCRAAIKVTGATTAGTAKP